MEATTSIIGKRFACSLPPSIPQQHPWLVISHGKYRQRQTFFSVSEDRRYVRTIPELRGQAIWASHNEWLVLTDFNLTECSLLNLVSMGRIKLPPMQSKRHMLCVLTSSPSTPDCKIIFFDIYRNNGSPLLVCKPGDAKFDEVEVDDNVICNPVAEKFDDDDEEEEEEFVDKGFWESATVFNGNIYLFHISFALFVVDFCLPRPRIVQIVHQEDDWRDGVPPNIVDYSRWLVESNGELLVITMLRYGRNVKEIYGFTVHRFDFIDKSWVDVKSIGKTRAIFLDTRWAMSCPSTNESDGLKGNSIYFIKDDDRCLYVFDLETKMISFSLPCPDVNRPCPYSDNFNAGRRRRAEFHWINIPGEG